MTRLLARAAAAAVALLLAPGALALDAPHYDTVELPDVCGECHVGHVSSYPSLLSQDCTTNCHNASGGSATPVEGHSSTTTSTTYGTWSVPCTDCHDAHAQTHTSYGTGYFIRDEIDPTFDTGIPTFTITLNSRSGSSGTLADGAGGDVCEGCHTQTGHYRNSDTGPQEDSKASSSRHNQGTDCISCHPHTSGFAGSGGCQVCHETAKGTGNYRRAVADSSSGDFVRATHHVTDGTTAHVISDDDCIVCHDQSNHQSYSTGYEAYFNDPDGGTSHLYDGNGASLEDFCVNCHDADGASAFSAQPFTDGRAVVDVGSDWASSSHATGLTTHACQSCHGGTDSTRTGLSYDRNAHGSANDSLLSSTVASESPSNMEEDLCFACHDGSPASTDVESDFGLGSTPTGSSSSVYRHPVVDSEQSSLGTASARSPECTSCHDPHAATSTDLVAGVSGVDLSGTALPAGDPVEEYEVCFKCHGCGNESGRTLATDKCDEFATDSPSYHPVVQAGRNQTSAMSTSLSGSGYTSSSTFGCTACHASDTSSLAGPHGSSNKWILVADYARDNTGSSSLTSSDWALCFGCHSSTPYMSSSGSTNFDSDNFHDYHMGDAYDTDMGCDDCHYNTHSNVTSDNTTWRICNGVSSLGGASAPTGCTDYDASSPPTGYRTRLISFSPDVDPAGSATYPVWAIDISDGQGGCYVNCHAGGGKTHSTSGEGYTSGAGGGSSVWTY